VKTGEKETDALGGAIVARSGEMAISAQAEKSKALVQAAYVMATQRPRNVEQARQEIIETCKSPRFAEVAIYSKPIGKTNLRGPSIRFAELAVQSMGNIGINTSVIYEDDDSRVVNVQVIDYQKNISYGQDITVKKVVERRQLKAGQTAISERENSTGQRVYLVAATDDEMDTKTLAGVSKVIRNQGLRLIPQHIIEEAMDVAAATIRNGGKDPKEYLRRWLDAFGRRGVSIAELEGYFGMPIDQFSGPQFEELAAIHQSIKDGHSVWTDYKKSKASEPEKGTVSMDKMSEKKEPSEPGQPDDPPTGLNDPPTELFNQGEDPGWVSVRDLFKTNCDAKGMAEDQKAEAWDRMTTKHNFFDWPELDTPDKCRAVKAWIHKMIPVKEKGK
jgi:hypothetical protein